MKVLYSKKNGISNKLSGVNLPVDADKINYDNTDSELQSTNVQDAIDEVVESLDNKVDKVTDKGLSTNDYDNTDKAKVDKIDETTTAVTGNPISISGLKSNQLAKDPIITLEPIQAGSGDPSPSNVRAISGYDKIEVLSTDKNILNNREFYNTLIQLGGVAQDEDTVSVLVSAWQEKVITNVKFKPNTSYTIILNGSNSMSANTNILLRYTDGTVANLSQFNNNGVSVTVTSSSKTVAYLEGAWYDGITTLNTNLCGIFEGEITAEQFEPFNPATNIQLTLGQTVYGGSLDLETGVLTVDREKVILTGNEFSYTLSSSIFGFQVSGYKYRDDSDYGEYLGNRYKSTTGSWSGMANNTFMYVDNYIGIKDTSNMPDLSTAVTYVQTLYNNGTPLEFILLLATPYTIQLTPKEISLLKDYAYVSTNGTNMTFSYKNGEMASLGDVESLGKTVNALGDVKAVTLSYTVNSNYISTPYITALRIGRVVFVNINAEVTSINTYSNVLFGGLPKPVSNSNPNSIFFAISGATGSARLQLNSFGNITNDDLITSGWYAGLLVYFTDD